MEPQTPGVPGQVTVIKRNLQGVETWRYSGRILEQTSSFVRLEAHFNRPDVPFHGILLKEGDRFVEEFFTDRWYNIFAIFDRDTGELKGWYCNLTYPAQFTPQEVSYTDLALDLLVYPDGRQLILDQDEFAELPLTPEDRAQSLKALQELQSLFSARIAVKL